jgi:hypothetical protein
MLYNEGDYKKRQYFQQELIFFDYKIFIFLKKEFFLVFLKKELIESE